MSKVGQQYCGEEGNWQDSVLNSKGKFAFIEKVQFKQDLKK